MRPAQIRKHNDRALLKVARQLKSLAADRSFLPGVPFGETYAMPENAGAYTATMGVQGWVFGISLVVHADGVQHWRGIARPRNGFSVAPTAEDLDVLGLFVGEVTHDNQIVLGSLRDQLQGHRGPDGCLHFLWFEGENVPKSPLDSMLRTMGALVSDKIRELPDSELETMKKALTNIRAKIEASPPEAEDRSLLDKLDEARGLIETEEVRRQNAEVTA